MSSDTNPNEAIQSADNEKPIITKRLRSRLWSLGYSNDHIDRMGAERALEVIAAKERRPGSKAAIKKLKKVMTKAGLPEVPGVVADEVIQERAAKTIQATPGVAVALDEFTNNCLKGDDPLDAIIIAHQERFPGVRFRNINPDLPAVAGPQFQPVHDEKGKAIITGGMPLGFMPEDVYQESYVKPNLERAARMAGKIKDPKAMSEGEKGGDLSLRPELARLVPVQGEGLHLERSVLSRA